MLSSQFPRQLHELSDFRIDVALGHHPEIVVVLNIAGNIGNFFKTKLVRIRAVKRKYRGHEVLAEPRDIHDALPGGGQPDHCFGRMDGHRANFSEFSHKMVEKPHYMLRLSGKKILQRAGVWHNYSG